MEKVRELNLTPRRAHPPPLGLEGKDARRRNVGRLGGLNVDDVVLTPLP